MGKQQQGSRARNESRRIMIGRLVAIAFLAAVAAGFQSIQGCSDSKDSTQHVQQGSEQAPQSSVAFASQVEPEVATSEPVLADESTEQDSVEPQIEIEEAVIASEEEPETAWEWYLRGIELRRSGQADQAVASLQRTVEMAPEFVKGWINLARVYLDKGDSSQALEAATRATEIDSSSADAFVVLGRAYHNLNRIEEAVTAYEQAISLDDQNPFAYNNLGLIYVQQERFEEALPYLRKAVELRDDVAYFHNNLGIALERLGRLDEAAEAYRKALDLEPDYTKAKANLERVEGLQKMKEPVKLSVVMDNC